MAANLELGDREVRGRVLRLAERFLFQPKLLRGGARLISVVVGPKLRGGVVLEKQLAVIFLVDRKVDVPDGDGLLLDGEPRLFEELFGPQGDPALAGRRVLTDVQEIGEVRPLLTVPALFHTTYGTLRRVSRPATPGASIGHARLPGAGTLGMFVTGPGGALYALGNNHVLALEAGTVDGQPVSVGPPPAAGDAILQPGYEGPDVASEPFATLTAWTDLAYVGSDPTLEPINYADAALARVDARVADPRFPYHTVVGQPAAARVLTPQLSEGDLVRKVGKATGLTFGRILHVGVPVRITYTNGAAVFRNQCIATHMSVNGDSGSVVLAADGTTLYGLVFAGSNDVTIFSPLRQVLQVLEKLVLGVPPGSLQPA